MVITEKQLNNAAKYLEGLDIDAFIDDSVDEDGVLIQSVYIIVNGLTVELSRREIEFLAELQAKA